MMANGLPWWAAHATAVATSLGIGAVAGAACCAPLPPPTGQSDGCSGAATARGGKSRDGSNRHLSRDEAYALESVLGDLRALHPNTQLQHLILRAAVRAPGNPCPHRTFAISARRARHQCQRTPLVGTCRSRSLGTNACCSQYSRWPWIASTTSEPVPVRSRHLVMQGRRVALEALKLSELLALADSGGGGAVAAGRLGAAADAENPKAAIVELLLEAGLDVPGGIGLGPKGIS